MLIITLGTQASASTWVFNVVRELLALHHPGSVSGYAERGADAIRLFHPDAPYVVVKAHSLDTTMLGLAAVAPARVIVTSRDPRDILVSQEARFGHSLPVATQNVTKSLLAIAALPPHLETLRLRYEDDFTQDPTTVSRIANFIGIEATSAECDQIAAGMTRHSVAERIAEWVDRHPEKSAEDWDTQTEWHPGHLGDGLVGKWAAKLPRASIKAANGALLPFDVDQDWRTGKISWSPELFLCVSEPGSTEFKLDGGDGIVVWGPYLTLPSGRWQITPVVTTDPDTPLTIAMDIFTIGTEPGLREMKTVTLPLASPSRMAFEVDVIDHTHPMEMRIFRTRDGGQGTLKFGGARLKYLGESFAAKRPAGIKAAV